jgi:hypothetical protein
LEGPWEGLRGRWLASGSPSYEAKRYETRLTKGGILVSVHADNNDWSRKAKEILKKSGAEDISEVGDSRAA